MRFTATLVLAVLAPAITGGCLAPQRVALPASVETLGIPMLRNNTLEYGVEEPLTDVLVQEFIRDGRLRVVRPSRADAVLNGTIEKYRIASRQYDDEDHAIGFIVEVELKVEMRDARNGDLLAGPRSFHQSGIFFETLQPGRNRQDDVFIRLSQEIISDFLENW